MSTLANTNVVYRGRFCWSGKICLLGGTCRYLSWIIRTAQ